MLLSPKKLETMSVDDRLAYFKNLKEQCLGIKETNKDNKIVKKIITTVAPKIRNYDFTIIGAENIPTDGNAIFACNHSNAHDFFTMQEAFDRLDIPISFLASNEDLSSLILNIFESCGATLMDRKDKDSAEQGLYIIGKKFMTGKNSVIFPESTWNMHPIRPMQPVKAGITMLGAAEPTKPIIPVIFEYIETPMMCTKEKEIYTHVIVSFGRPIFINPSESIILQTDYLQKEMEKMRKKIWEDNGIRKESLSDINQALYLNHTYLKKFGANGAEFDSLREMRYLLPKEGIPVENEYTLDSNGIFGPGIIHKEDVKRFVMKKL